MMARAASSKPSSTASAASRSRTPANLEASSGSPITPVEATNTSPGAQPAALAAMATVASTASRPRMPVKALALPELTTSARALPPARPATHHSTGAERVRDWVTTPATRVPSGISTKSTSLRFL